MERKGYKGWLERTNPLEGLSIREAQNIYDTARAGNYARLQYIYDNIEKTDPVLMTCVERRASALAGLGWKTSASAAANDETLADEQKNAIALLADRLRSLPELIEHMGLAFFRGYSHAAILRSDNGTPHGFDLLNSWNFCYDSIGKAWYWNPESIGIIPGEGCPLERIPDGELVSVVRPRAIDYPALSIYIRHALAERDWGRFLERYGIPPVNVIMPENTTEKQKDDFMRALDGTRRGESGAWTAGTQITYASEARGVNPFLDFIRHQEEQTVLLATGGTLTSLAQSGTGTLAGGAQMDVWEQIVRRDAVIIGDTIDRAVFEPYLRAQFPGKPIVAHFELGHDAEMDPAELFQLAAQAKASGYLIAQDVLEEESGFTLEKDTPQQPMGMPGMMNSTLPPSPSTLNPAENAVATPVQEPGKTQSDEVLEAFAKTTGPAAEAVKKLLANPTPEAAQKLMGELPGLIPDDPALSAVIADAMAESMSKTVAANSRVEEDDYIPMSKEEIEELVNEEPGWHLATEEDEK